ncbi:neprosin family prolyl endopeptidase [Actinoplanes sp. NEAU-A12]|uniref:Neprosin family prolyl endopeptidase n=1 Tax=Actinoplanes sandaracinus TaxID=3045177 RepID=A0ABT6WL95_9ACTN|nr:neprosin family prolyl endopeptidase [Actinoplanes sandaracinus]MDI6100506.1 neprosin family prolyl endopeptidase [Actinoplanes sandaracinus]
MLKSRRGLLAAGITAAVIGSIGIVSTLHAGAEQIPVSPAPAPAAVSAGAPQAGAASRAATGAEAAPELTPPSTLPWGQRPEEIRTGRDGASSRALKAAGLDAAAPDTSGREADEEYAPKGRSSRGTFLKSEKTTVVPPEPPGVTPTAAASDKPTVHFLYNVGSQAAVSEGAYANLTISKPTLDRPDYHTLAELAVQSADGAQIVEVGWNVDRVVNGDDDPHLFVFHWADRKSTCYNGCGFVQFSENIRPGDTLPQDATKRFGLQYFNKAWWVAYDTEWVGYFPAELWTVDFSKTGMVQVFGEVAAASEKPCTQMGNGRRGDDNTSARIGSLAFVNGPPADMFVRSTSDVYTAVKLSARTFRYGGPGAC